MSGQLSMFGETTSPDTTSSTSSPGSASGPEPSPKPKRPLAIASQGRSSPAHVHVSRFRSLDSGKAMSTNDTSGPLFTASSPSAALQRSLESRLRARMGGSGWPLFAVTWRPADMPSGTAILPAGGFGAPHLRYRLFFVADAHGARRQSAGRGFQDGSPDAVAECGATGFVAQPAGQGPQGRGSGGGSRPWRQGSAAERGGASGALGHADFAGRQALDLQPQRAGARSGQFEEPSLSRWLADAEGERERPDEPRSDRREGLKLAGPAPRRNSRDHGSTLWPRPPDSFWDACDWIFCRDNRWRPIEPGSFPLVDGTAFYVGSGGPYEGMSRAGMLRGYGNAVVLPVARAFIEAVLGE